MTYWQTYRDWLLKLIKERIYLSQKGYRADLLQTAVDLKRLIDYHGYRSNELLAGLIIRKQTELKELIPNNNAYDTQSETLKRAIAEASKHTAKTGIT